MSYVNVQCKPTEEPTVIRIIKANPKVKKVIRHNGNEVEGDLCGLRNRKGTVAFEIYLDNADGSPAPIEDAKELWRNVNRFLKRNC